MHIFLVLEQIELKWLQGLQWCGNIIAPGVPTCISTFLSVVTFVSVVINASLSDNVVSS